jgi:hypothetical protein
MLKTKSLIMKKRMLFLACLFGFSNLMRAQSSSDPLDLLKGHYTMGSSAELVLQYAPTSGIQVHQLYDFPSDLNPSVTCQQSTNDTLKIARNRNMDVATGDINGDNNDDIISAWQIANHSIALSIPNIRQDTLAWSTNQIILIDSADDSGVRIITGHFDNRYKKRFVLAFNGMDGRLHIQLYKSDNLFKIEKVSEITYDTLQISNTEFGLKLWDIAAGDFDGDGLDELVTINPQPPLTLSTDKYRITSKINVYDVDPISGQLIHKTTQLIPANTSYGEGLNCYTQLSRVAITTGDFDGNGKDEVVYSFEQDYFREYTKTVWILFVPIYYHYYYSYFTEKLHALRLSEDLTNVVWSSSLNTINSEFLDYGETSHFFKNGFPLSICSYDLNKDGKDEIIAHGCKNLGIFNMDSSSLATTCLATYAKAYSRYEGKNRRTLAVADLFARPDSASTWSPEIVMITYPNNPIVAHYFPYAGKANITICRPKLSADNKITGISLVRTIATGLDTSQASRLAMAIGDFDGDTLKLGQPTVTKKSVVIPTIIVNAPPSHFDVLNKQTYDINKLYDDNSADDTKTQYSSSSSSTGTNTTQLKQDWGVSSEVKAGGGFFGVSVEASLSASYGKEFSKTTSSTTTVIMTSSLNTSNDDLVFGLNTDYYFYEYPVYFKGKRQGDILVSNPIKRDNKWIYSKSMDYSLYSLSHEPENILSYPSFNSVVEIPELFGNSNVYKSDASFTLTDASDPNTWELNYSKLQSASVQQEQKFNIAMEASVSGWGCSASFKGEYGQSKMSSHETSLQNGFSVISNFGKIDKSIGEVTYSLTPYVYWSAKGALVVDYNVDLSTADGTKNWWDINYGQNPDLAFIMPFRNDSAKNVKHTFDAKQILTSDIRYFPFDAKTGDTITILAMVRNFSLKDFSGNAKVKFYLGDPDNGGELINEYQLTSLNARKSQTFSFKWKTPSSIPAQPWIFGVIDPENSISEIHRNNNKAFTFLFSDNYPPYVKNNAYLDDLGSGSDTTSVSNCQNKYLLKASNFPNPACTQTTIQFYLNEEGPATISVYNQLGVLIEQKVAGNNGIGWHLITLDVSSYARGVYFYRIMSGNNQITKKLMVE